jgi:thiol:disulfide interchange protein
MNAESHSAPHSAAPDNANLAARLAELDELQRQRNASPHNGVALSLILAAAIGLPLLFFGFIKAGQVYVASRAAAATTLPLDAPRTINWIYEVKAGSQLAVAENKSMMIVFYTDWCPACHWMDANIYNQPWVAAEAQHIVPVKINAEGQPAIANQYAIKKYPTIVWTDSVGNEKFRQVGGSSQGEFITTMRQYQ